MSANPTSRKVTFRHPFLLPGMEQPHAPGTFELQVEQEALDVSWEAHRIRMTLLLTGGGTTEAWPLTAAELEAMIAADQAYDADNGHS